MKQNNIQFNLHLQKISTLLKEAQKEENPGRYLFQNDLRTPLFQVEALARIYRVTGPKKKRFGKIGEKFKQLEDMLGSIDYFEAISKEYSDNKKIPEDVRSYFSGQEEKVLRKFNKLLKTKNWLDGKQLKKISRDLEKINWKGKDEQHSRLVKFYRSEIEKIMDFAKNGKQAFKDVESGIHEFRRKLRWLSIYAQALQGCIELVDIEQERLDLENYLTDSVLSSPYNKLPLVEDKKMHPLALSKFCFYAISWMIEQLGILKDQGLGLLALAEAVKETEGIKIDKAIIRASEYLDKNEPSIADILSEANGITKQFFKDKILINLLK
ncbi:hypothetical protein ACR78Z_04040 [Sphingobacterium thalpophilum]|uniref:CHAD domain n=2 Tax=Bacteroidota TaxID=976 RepID=A0A4U9VSR4_9SPHI|nr:MULTISPECIES: hypothetical protein [Bacteroidota]OJV50353.1 MAG: hypothetical protein BGO31_13340 [Bacteroidetes bacterium 43-16]AZA84118.1 hypothetical protein EG342_20490 [Chryseobacterium lactis]AZB04504.1 hypothetical protein EG341_11365 [Chryseobacterium lactis]MCT3745483.1 hypothetical protein [Elizabethkingia anophelis]MDC8026230.1 hypothetical protein [Elizabethkingia anophelis]